MKARIKALKGNLTDLQYLALEIEGVTFRISDSDYQRIEQGEGAPHAGVEKFIGQIVRTLHTGETGNVTT